MFLDYSVIGFSRKGQLRVRVWLTVKIIVQYDLWHATNLSKVLLHHQNKKVTFLDPTKVGALCTFNGLKEKSRI